MTPDEVKAKVDELFAADAAKTAADNTTLECQAAKAHADTALAQATVEAGAAATAVIAKRDALIEGLKDSFPG